VVILLASCQQNQQKMDGDIYYTCSMDPQIIELKPGNCPVCKMPLTPVKKHHTPNSSDLQLSDQQVQLGNITTAIAKEQDIGDELLLTGVLTVDQNKITSISSRVSGRVEKLYFKNIGDEINTGQPIYEIYSEDLNLAARELKLALDKKKSLNAAVVDIDKIINSAKNKLALYGLSEKQINQITNDEINSNVFTIISSVSGTINNVLIKEGDYVTEGGSIYQLADYSDLWAQAQVFVDDLNNIKEKMPATLSYPGIVGLKTNGKISFVNPELNSSSQINLVRIEVPNKNGGLKAGMQVNVSVLLNKIQTLAIPTGALLQDEHGVYVWKQTGHNQFKNVMVTISIATSNYTQITSGITNGDTIVVSGAYLLNSEYIFKNGGNPMERHEM
jgi:Cu(I)/Ag(I) efflux system membrane fusion protein